MHIAIGGDHAGYPLKQHLIAFLQARGYTLTDLGTHSTESTDYPDFAKAVGTAVQNGTAERGLIVCGSGIGACVAANKLRGIRAALCHDTYSARQGVDHDDVNVLCLGGRVIGPALAEDVVLAFLNARFSAEERHLRRLRKIAAMEG